MQPTRSHTEVKASTKDDSSKQHVTSSVGSGSFICRVRIRKGAREGVGGFAVIRMEAGLIAAKQHANTSAQ